MAMALVIKTKTIPSVSSRLSQKFAKLWIAAEVILFVLVGAAVDIDYALSAGFGVVIMIFLALIFRVAGVFFCVLGTKLSRRERLFCMIAYIPKATVQAAIGSVPLSLGLPLRRSYTYRGCRGHNNNGSLRRLWNGYDL